jgi:uncharacterized membrane protein
MQDSIYKTQEVMQQESHLSHWPINLLFVMDMVFLDKRMTDTCIYCPNISKFDFQGKVLIIFFFIHITILTFHVQSSVSIRKIITLKHVALSGLSKNFLDVEER